MSRINNRYIEEYIRKTLPSSQGILEEMEVYAYKNNVPIIHKEVAALLRVLTKAANVKKILEVGTAIAYSAILFCDSMGKQGTVTTIERDEKMVEIARQNIDKAGLTKNIRIIQGEAEEILRFMQDKYDLIFLDGAKGQYNEFLNYCIDLLKPGGLLVSDNILYKGMVATDELVVRRKRTIVNRMRHYLEYICDHPQLDTSIIPIGDGLAISYKKQEGNQ